MTRDNTPTRALTDDDAFKACTLRRVGWSYAAIALNMQLESQSAAHELVLRGLDLPKSPTDRQRTMEIMRVNKLPRLKPIRPRFGRLAAKGVV